MGNHPRTLLETHTALRSSSHSHDVTTTTAIATPTLRGRRSSGHGTIALRRRRIRLLRRRFLQLLAALLRKAGGYGAQRLGIALAAVGALASFSCGCSRRWWRCAIIPGRCAIPRGIPSIPCTFPIVTRLRRVIRSVSVRTTTTGRSRSRSRRNSIPLPKASQRNLPIHILHSSVIPRIGPFSMRIMVGRQSSSSCSSPWRAVVVGIVIIVVSQARRWRGVRRCMGRRMRRRVR
mmetsp:Transcript_1915/g.3971  ORF Transcript_1915/g.3971 Transcript_1915/m.3971 type:complete len:234 (-) Transcript_1915:488-1189(-)